MAFPSLTITHTLLRLAAADAEGISNAASHQAGLSSDVGMSANPDFVLSFTGLPRVGALGPPSGDGSAAFVVGGDLLGEGNSMSSNTNYKPYTDRSVMVYH